MLTELVVVLVSVFPSVVIGATIAKKITNLTGAIAVMQVLVGAAIGLFAIEVLGLAPIVLAGTVIGSQFANVLAALLKWKNVRHQRRALNGEFGDMTKWGAQITKDGDEEFAEAIEALPETEKMEIAIIAESKEELRELAVERFEEMT